MTAVKIADCILWVSFEGYWHYKWRKKIPGCRCPSRQLQKCDLDWYSSMCPSVSMCCCYCYFCSSQRRQSTVCGIVKAIFLSNFKYTHVSFELSSFILELPHISFFQQVPMIFSNAVSHFRSDSPDVDVLPSFPCYNIRFRLLLHYEVGKKYWCHSGVSRVSFVSQSADSHMPFLLPSLHCTSSSI